MENRVLNVISSHITVFFIIKLTETFVFSTNLDKVLLVNTKISRLKPAVFNSVSSR